MTHILLYNHYIVTVFNTEEKNTQTYVGSWQKHKETKYNRQAHICSYREQHRVSGLITQNEVTMERRQ